jgi:D-serine deaminase-like pyridoxal phosphate-dependent protein
MVPRAPAQVGDKLDEIDTPALVVDLDLIEANIRTMASFAQDRGIRLRPHAKTHKCAAIARMQVAAGAVGVCCQKVGEAEAMADEGITDVLVSNQIVGRRKLDRLAALSKRIRVAVCADHADNVDEINTAAIRFDTSIPVLVELDVGAGRCGVASAEEARALALRIAGASHLSFGGVQAYHGSAQHFRTYDERRAAIAGAGDLLRATLDLLDAEGLACEIVGGGGTGTYQFEAASGLWNELQVGSYVFMDHDYALNLDEHGQPVSEFSHSLTVRTTVMSTPGTDRAVTDAGLKAYSVDSGLPVLRDGLDGDVLSASDEHTTIRIANPNQRPVLGEALDLIPGHCDPTVNLHDWIVGVRDGTVETIWPVDARGALF